MTRMKRLLILAVSALFLLPLTASAQKEKVVERSDKRKPEWIGRSDADAISVTEVGETLAEASERCMASIRQQIVNAVAVNISSTEKMTSRQITRDNLMTVMNDYSSNLMTEAAKLPYISDIALSNAEEVYWERIYSRKDKTYRYEYSVRYPFTEQTRRQLVDAFVAIDDAKVREYERLRDELGTIDNIDRIGQAVNELEALYGYFFDATRRGETEALRRNYLGLFNRISIETESESAGSCIYSLRLDGRRVTTSVQPRLKSDSAMEMSVRACDDNRYILTYNPEYASGSEVNVIEIRYVFGGVAVSRTIVFDPSENRSALQPVGTIDLEQTEGRLCGKIRLRVQGKAVDVLGLELRNPADGETFKAAVLGPTRLGEGECSIGFEAEASVGHAAGGLDVIRGTITYANPSNGQNMEREFVLPFRLITK